MRMHGHGAHDDMSYVPAEMREEWAQRDPIERYRRAARRRHGFSADEVEAIRAEVRAYVDECARAGARLADARSRLAREGVFAESVGAARRRAGAVVVLGSERNRGGRMSTRPPTRAPATGGGQPRDDLPRGDLRRPARRDAPRRSVFCLGEDIGAFGGAFKVTDGFVEEFGAERVLDTPLAENAIIGAAVGAAVEGLRPVCEMQFADFIACGFDQLVNVAAKMHYRQGVAVPMVVRLPSGGGFSGGPFHSQNPEAWFLQAPGLKVVAPATAADAKGLLASAIRDPNPVCFLEHKGLYRRVKGEVPEGEHRCRSARPGRPRGRRDDGDRLRLGGATWRCEAAEELDEEIEVLDLRTLCPLDTEAILASARKTGKVLVAHEATRSCGVGAEVAALVAERGVRGPRRAASGG